MSVDLRWVGDDERERVAETRMLCYAPARAELSGYIERIKNDARVKAGDFLLAEQDGEAIGTATSIAMTMWARGAPVSCQGVGHVGTIKTHRRKTADGPGVATLVMNETLRAARERGFVVSALMPFRGSFYEHFGYGFVERRMQWTLPIGVLPKGEFQGIRFFRGDALPPLASSTNSASLREQPSADHAGASDDASDLAELVRFKQRVTERGHGDIERSHGVWERSIKSADAGHVIVDHKPGGTMRSVMSFEHSHDQAGRDTVRVTEIIYEDVPALLRQLHFLASLRDQYTDVTLTLPADLRLNLLLTETQMTHRANRNHPTAEGRPFNRMQVRVLDHVKLLKAMNVHSDLRGSVVVGIREAEAGLTKLAIEIANGQVSAKATDASVQVEMPDRIWAPVVFGELRASEARRLGLVDATDERALSVLHAFAEGPAPWCHEYF